MIPEKRRDALFRKLRRDEVVRQDHELLNDDVASVRFVVDEFAQVAFFGHGPLVRCVMDSDSSAPPAPGKQATGQLVAILELPMQIVLGISHDGIGLEVGQLGSARQGGARHPRNSRLERIADPDGDREDPSFFAWKQAQLVVG